jgi:hypothetical protein
MAIPVVAGSPDEPVNLILPQILATAHLSIRTAAWRLAYCTIFRCWRDKAQGLITHENPPQSLHERTLSLGLVRAAAFSDLAGPSPRADFV